jgi:hypothetical protein
MQNALKLVWQWREEAEMLRTRYRNEELAALCEAHASDLEHQLHTSDAESVTIQQAAAISGFSYSHLRRLMDSGALTNVGEPGAPRLLVGQLPMKPGRAAGIAARRAVQNAEDRQRRAEGNLRAKLVA